jgi:hypothetical protein
MNYTYHASISSSSDYFKKIYQFLLAQGWTINEFRDADSIWDSAAPYGWIAGTQSFLDVQAPVAHHCGIQKLRYNLWLHPHSPVSLTTEDIEVMGVDPSVMAGEYQLPVVLTRVGTAGTATFAIAPGFANLENTYFYGMTTVGEDIHYQGNFQLHTTGNPLVYTFTMTGTPASATAGGSPVANPAALYNPADNYSTHKWGPGGDGARAFTLPKGSFTGCWFFENGYSFWSVVQPTADTDFLWGFGMPNLTSEYKGILDVQQVYVPCLNRTDWTLLSSADSSYAGWMSGESYPFHMSGTGGVGPYSYIEGNMVNTINGTLVYNLVLGKQTTQGLSYFDNMNDVVLLNSFNNTRSTIVPDVYIKRVATGVWERVGTMPVAKVYFPGLNVGDHLFCGAEEYLVFPNMSTSVSYWGTLLRIA